MQLRAPLIFLTHDADAQRNTMYNDGNCKQLPVSKVV